MSVSLQDCNSIKQTSSEGALSDVGCSDGPLNFPDRTRQAGRESARVDYCDPSQSRLQLLIQQSPLAVIEWNTDLEITAWNPAAEQMFGYPCDEILGKPFNLIIPAALHPAVEEFVQGILSQTGSCRAINETVTRSGECILCEWFSAPLIAQTGEVLGGVSMVMNVTDQKNAEDALKESQSQLENLTNNLPGVVYKFKMDRQGNVSFPFISNRSRDLFELEPDDVRTDASHMIQMINPEDLVHFRHAVTHSIETLTGFYWAGRFQTSSGLCKWIEARSIPERQPDGSTIWDGVMLDITVRKMAESDRKRAKEELQRKNQALEVALHQVQQSQAQVVQAEKMSALGNLVAGVAHEINNPIGFLNGSLKNAQEYLQDLLKHLALYQQHYPNAALPIQDHAEEIDLEFLVEDFTKLVDSMKGATDRIKAISTSLRTFSRADAEHKIETNLHDGIESTLLILKYRLKANEFRPAIDVITDYGDLPSIRCFPGQLNQVFMNLLANAIDVFDEVAQTSSFEQLKITPQHITIQTRLLADQQVEIRIRDNGPGMPEEVRSRVFDHLFTTKSIGKGTGLGLTIAREIVTEIHQGQIEVISAIAEGTEFILTLPI